MSENNQMPKKSRKRSSSYPAFSLGEIVESTKILKDKLGDGPYSREHMAVALGYKGVTGSSGAKIAACVHFGMLERNGNTYSQSELANRFFNYLDEQERSQILLEAFGKPTLYQKLITEYSGKSLPLMLESIFVRNYGIQESVARGAVVNFKDSAEFVGALKNGVLNVELGGDAISEGQPVSAANHGVRAAHSIVSAQNGGQAAQNPANSINSGHLSVKLPSGLVVSYTQELAPAFAFGIFGQKLMELDRAIADYRKTLDGSGGGANDALTDEG